MAAPSRCWRARKNGRSPRGTSWACSPATARRPDRTRAGTPVPAPPDLLPFRFEQDQVQMTLFAVISESSGDSRLTEIALGGVVHQVQNVAALGLANAPLDRPAQR